MPEEQEEEEEEEEQITVDTPQVTCDLGRDIQLVKLPTFMKMEPKYWRKDLIVPLHVAMLSDPSILNLSTKMSVRMTMKRAKLE